MLSENDYGKIKKHVEKQLNQDCAYYNQRIDLGKLIPAVSKAIADAIALYDQLQR